MFKNTGKVDFVTGIEICLGGLLCQAIIYGLYVLRNAITISIADSGNGILQLIMLIIYFPLTGALYIMPPVFGASILFMWNRCPWYQRILGFYIFFIVGIWNDFFVFKFML